MTSRSNVDEPWTAERMARRFAEVKRVVEEERRSRFAPFGIAPDCLWPCSRLFHEQSALGPAWHPTFTNEQVEAFTRNLDYKRYPGAERVELPHPPQLSADLETAIRKRRSVREFSPGDVSLEQLAKLLELGSGVTERDSIPRRAAPSGGGLYPIETYVSSIGVGGLRPAVWHYAALEHALEHVRPLGGVEEMAPFFPPGLLEGKPRLVLTLSAVFARTQLKYIERGYRFALLEAGHIAQNFVLTAGALGLGAVCVGGFWDDPYNHFLGLDADREAVVYAVMLGHP